MWDPETSKLLNAAREAELQRIRDAKVARIMTRLPASLCTDSQRDLAKLRRILDGAL
jgi:hypothetical protein